MTEPYVLNEHCIGCFPHKSWHKFSNIAQITFQVICLQKDVQCCLRCFYRQYWLDNIPMQWWEPLGQHCTVFSPMQCHPKSIKTTLNRIFFYALLSGASRTTLYKVFPVQGCPRRQYSCDSIAQTKSLKKQSTWKNPIQWCLNTIAWFELVKQNWFAKISERSKEKSPLQNKAIFCIYKSLYEKWAEF